MQERRSGDQGRIRTGPPGIGIVLTETYDGKSSKEEKRSLRDSQS